MREKQYSCPDCLVVFRIVVEPEVPTEEELKINYPKSLKWLKDVCECPICGANLEKGE